MKIRWLKRTELDIEEAFDWLAERNLTAAWEMLDRIRKRGKQTWPNIRNSAGWVGYVGPVSWW